VVDLSPTQKGIVHEPALYFNSNDLLLHKNEWLKLMNSSGELVIKFRFFIYGEIKGLTFIHTHSGDELHELLYSKFKQDPNVRNCFIIYKDSSSK
jgi:hypothetical protein